jgi:hypothetical protein
LVERCEWWTDSVPCTFGSKSKFPEHSRTKPGYFPTFVFRPFEKSGENKPVTWLDCWTQLNWLQKNNYNACTSCCCRASTIAQASSKSSLGIWAIVSSEPSWFNLQKICQQKKSWKIIVYNNNSYDAIHFAVSNFGSFLRFITTAAVQQCLKQSLKEQMSW